MIGFCAIIKYKQNIKYKNNILNLLLIAIKFIQFAKF